MALFKLAFDLWCGGSTKATMDDLRHIMELMQLCGFVVLKVFTAKLDFFFETKYNQYFQV